MRRFIVFILCLSVITPSWGAWGSSPVVSLIAGLGINGGTSSSIDTSGADTIFFTVGNIGGAGVAVSDSNSNTWTLVKAQDNGNGLYSTIYRSATPATVGTGHTFTATLTNGQVSIGVSAWTGGATSSIDDQTNGQGGIFTATSLPGPITPTQDGTLVIAAAACSDDNREPSSIDSGFTVTGSHVSGSFSINNGHYYLVQGSAAALDPTITIPAGSATLFASTIANFKAAAAGATTPVCLPPFCGVVQ